jgi:hypothetical protein
VQWRNRLTRKRIRVLLCGFEDAVSAKPVAIATKAPYPGFIETALATSVDKVPSGGKFAEELAYVTRRFFKTKAWAGTERIVCGRAESANSPSPGMI